MPVPPPAAGRYGAVPVQMPRVDADIILPEWASVAAGTIGDASTLHFEEMSMNHVILLRRHSGRNIIALFTHGAGRSFR